MKLYTNKTKPLCGRWIKVITNDIKVFDLIIVPENSKYLKTEEFFWSEWKPNIAWWQYADKFDVIFRKRFHMGAFKPIKKRRK